MSDVIWAILRHLIQKIIDTFDEFWDSFELEAIQAKPLYCKLFIHYLDLQK